MRKLSPAEGNAIKTQILTRIEETIVCSKKLAMKSRNDFWYGGYRIHMTLEARSCMMAVWVTSIYHVGASPSLIPSPNQVYEVAIEVQYKPKLIQELRYYCTGWLKRLHVVRKSYNRYRGFCTEEFNCIGCSEWLKSVMDACIGCVWLEEYR